MKYYLIAGEASGDLHGSNLMKGLYAKDPGADIRFWGGALMDGVYREHQGGGDGFVKDYRDSAVMGYLEVLLKAGTIARKLHEAKRDIAAWKPDVVILIDYPGFNLKVAEFAHSRGIKVFYYIAPKLWASREGRVRKLKAWVDRLFIVFPFEKEYFGRLGVPYTYAGNPLIDAIDSHPALQESREAFLKRTGLPDVPMIALLAGSRNMEIGSMMPPFMAFADKWHEAYPEYLFLIAAAPQRSPEDYAKWLVDRPWVRVLFSETYAVLRHSRAAVINSGTASLEAALIGTPQVVAYRTARISYAIMRSLIRVKYISLANLIIGKAAFKELLQDYLTADNLFSEMRRILEDAPYREAMLEDYARVRELLGGSGASEAVAGAMTEYLKG